MNYSRLSTVAADTAITTTPTLLRSVILTASAAAGRVDIRDGGAAGTIVFTMIAAAAESVSWTAAAPEGCLLGTGLFVDVTGGVTAVTVEFEPIR